MKKEKIIIVRGAKTIEKHSRILRDLYMPILKRFFPELIILDDNYTKIWKKNLEKRNRQIIILDWDGSIDPISKYRAMRKLNALLKKNGKGKVKIIGISMGGDLVLDTLNKENVKDVDRVILIASKADKRDEKKLNKYLSLRLNQAFDISIEGFYRRK